MQAKKNTKNSHFSHLENPQSGEKMEAILRGAMQEFVTHGFTATTMDRVTAAAGVSKTTVYSYFQDKETLFTALIEHLIATCGGVFDRSDPEIFAGEPAAVLTSFANNLLNQFRKKVSNTPEILDLMRLMIAESGRFPKLAHFMVRAIDRNAVKTLTEYLRSHPELPITDPEATTRVFLGALVHYNMIENMLQAGEIMPMERERLIGCLVKLIVGEQAPTDRYTAIRAKSSRRKRSSSGQFQPDYPEAKKLRSLRLTDTAWENLDAIAQKHNLNRSELIERLARGERFN